MDLINMLIKTKQTDDFDLHAWLQELVQYDKLSKVKKFQHITESTFMQKKLPLCYQAFQSQPVSYYLCHELGLVIQQTTGQNLPLLDDLSKAYSKKQQRQLAIIGASQQYTFKYHDLRTLSDKVSTEADQVSYLQVQVNARTVALTAIVVNGHTIHIYSGTLHLKDDDVEIESQETLKPYQRKLSDQNQLSIRSYSVNGNNDYDFGWTNHYDIAMPDNHTFKFTQQDTHQVIFVHIQEDDVRAFSLERNHIDKFADLIIKYLPKGEV